MQLRADWVCIVRSRSRSHTLVTARKERQKSSVSARGRVGAGGGEEGEHRRNRQRRCPSRTRTGRPEPPFLREGAHGDVPTSGALTLTWRAAPAGVDSYQLGSCGLRSPPGKEKAGLLSGRIGRARTPQRITFLYRLSCFFKYLEAWPLGQFCRSV